MERITRKHLEALLDNVNSVLGIKYNLDNAPCYGGWQLWESREGESARFSGPLSIGCWDRLSSREMYWYLRGCIDMEYALRKKKKEDEDKDKEVQ